jgi:hypothetical protein
MSKLRGEAAGPSKVAATPKSAQASEATSEVPSLDELTAAASPDPAARYTGGAGGDPQEAVHLIEQKLGGLFVTDGEARAAVDALAGLTPPNRSLVWKALGPASQSRLLDEVDGPARGRLLDGLAEAGIVGRAEPTAHPKSTKASQRLLSDVWGAPPPAPFLLVREPGMPEALANGIHEENTARAGRYRAAYDDYLGAYRDQIVLPAAQHDDIASIRKAGPPAPLLLPEREPGAPLGAKGAELERADAWRKTSDPTQGLVDIYGPIHRAVRHARGELAAGELRFGGELAGSLLNTSFAVKGQMGQDRDLALKGVGGGTAAIPSGEALQTRGSVGVSLEGDKLTASLDGGVGGFGVSVKAGHDGALDVVGVCARLGIAELGADFEKGTASVGIGKSWGQAGVATVGAKVNAEFKPFLAPEDVGIFRTDEGFFDAPRELLGGARWDALPKERRVDLERTFGWSAKEWSDQAARKGKLQLSTMVR